MNQECLVKYKNGDFLAKYKALEQFLNRNKKIIKPSFSGLEVLQYLLSGETV